MTLGIVSIKKIESIEEISLYRIANNIKIYGIYIDTEINLVMEMLYCTLYDIQDLIITFSDDEKIEYLSQFTELLIKQVKQINSSGILIKDIKPDNIMLDKNGNVKIIDFGVSEIIPNNRMGTGFITPPELSIAHEFYTNNTRYNFSSDLFSVGVTILNVLFNTKYRHYIYKDGILYVGFCSDLEEKEYTSNNLIFKLLQMINCDPKKRFGF